MHGTNRHLILAKFYSDVSKSQVSSQYPFEVFREVPELRTFRRQLLSENRTVGLVPTMGALHQGHLSLIEAAARENTDVFVSIFVNPTQFGPTEDLATYPRTWDSDMAQLIELQKSLTLPNGMGRLHALGHISAIFAPTAKTMYPTLPPASTPDAHGSFVTIFPLGSKLEGAARPTFFRGVATVCTKLFNIVQPDRVYFGQKDVQQTAIINRMVRDFHIPTDVRIMPTSREPDGLAMSSRNVYLGDRRRAVGLALSRALFTAQKVYGDGELSRSKIVGAAHQVLNAEIKKQGSLQPGQRAWFEVDYVSLADYEGMDEIEDKVDPDFGAVLSAAMRMLPVEQPLDDEKSQKVVRLIDNVILAPRNGTASAL
ncbi:putative pantoate--beta-alanine ligase [Phaeomoniella chlamydospora]|uniref:Pantoate--beta-alanine ligase n=1 Tax=Phaeomoniella chlamydospora TaxID=158046 RepID=A0A0G2FUP8_PHACM|nr:putative pantoate--beta-alanine ligase [Phaeomoniella chlamydospora]